MTDHDDATDDYSFPTEAQIEGLLERLRPATPVPPEPPPPDPGAARDFGPFHPVTAAATSLRALYAPVLTEDDLLDLTCYLHGAMIADGIRDSGDSAVMLATQARVLDSIFNRIVAASCADPARPPNMDALRFAMLAQRQASTAIARLKRHDVMLQHLELRRDEISRKRSEGS